MRLSLDRPARRRSNRMTSSPIFRRIAALQDDLPWGAFLDAGTGRHSLQWVSALDTKSWTAVTGASGMAGQVQRAVGPRMRAQDRIVQGNWEDPDLLAGETYDTVLADYLLGALDGFSPYQQYRLFHRLRPLVGRRLYVVGLEPYVPYVPQDAAGQIVCEIGRVRDACLLLAGERPYREYPLEWVLEQLGQAGMRILDVHRFPIRYGKRFIDSQIDMCQMRLPRFAEGAVASAMQVQLNTLRERALALDTNLDGLRHGFDYLVAAQPD